MSETAPEVGCCAEEWQRDGRGLWAMRRCRQIRGHKTAHNFASWEYNVQPPMPQRKTGNHYGCPLETAIEGDALVIRIGIQTLAHAASYGEWANPFDEEADDYIRTFAITDARQFADDVRHAMLAEREDGSSPLSDFIDKASSDAVDDGSIGTDEARIKHGETDPRETWAATGVDPSSDRSL